MADLEHLSLFAEWDAAAQAHFVKNFPTRGERTLEPQALERLAGAGWKLTSMTPTYEQRAHGVPSHLLNFERELLTARHLATARGLRIVGEDGGVRTVPARAPTSVGAEADIGSGLSVRFLGVTRFKNGTPDSSLVGQHQFSHERSAIYTGLISIRSDIGAMASDEAGDIFCQFLYRGVDGSYRDDVHAPERLSLWDTGLIVGMPFGSAPLEPRVPLRASRFEYLIFNGDAQLSRAARVLIRYRFSITPAR